MKFRVDRDVLADAVTWAARTLPLRAPSSPALAGMLIEAGDQGLVLSAFDFETSARATLAAEVSEEGRALVSGKLLSEICRSLPDKPVEMVLEGPRVSLTCGSARFSLQTIPVEDYPTLPPMPAATGTVDSQLFAHAVSQAVTAAGRDDMLPVLTGVRIEISGSTISLLATDRFRLSHRELEWNPHSPDESAAALVPAKVLEGTAKSLTSGSEVTISLSGSAAGEGIIGFEGAGPGGVRRTTTRLLDGEFPKVRSLFPAEHLTTALVDKAALIESVKRVALVAERNTAVQLAFGDGGVTLDAGSGDQAQATEQVAADISGAELTTGFNHSFLLEGLNAVDEPVVELAFTQASKPVVMRGIPSDGSEDPGFKYLLMPRRLLS
ncbi:DNA polymerase III subunit beta [Nocardioides limicola]|uniref:DNA polymerase III subunit beta n=1 Tax=Nocardioides limicola TaxID=2803368 RepID=UPI00193BB59E|nr:DNA polymerase III subunit beta [Nocardioides sp. DJM-14]